MAPSNLGAAHSVITTPRSYSVNNEEWIEREEEANDLARKRNRETARMNRVSEYLGETFYRVGKTWPSLYWKMAGIQLSVGLYFPRLNLAVDRFPTPTSMERQEAAYKAMKLKELGIDYEALFPETSIKILKGYL